MAKTVRTQGRVVAVTPRGDDFSITIGPAPNLLQFVCSGQPPKLGDKLSIEGVIRKRKAIGSGNLQGTVAIIQDASFELVEEPYPVRVVSREWSERVFATMQRPLYRYQVDGAAWMASRLAAGKGAILGDDPGLGKTAQAIAAVCATGCFPALVVCPASVKTPWAREFLWSRLAPRVHIIEGRSSWLVKADVYVVNYDLLRHREEQFMWLRPRVIIYDEGHMLKEPKPRPQHRAAIGTRLAHAHGPALVLTGTPVLNRPQELWRLLHIVDRRSWPDYDEYRFRYCGIRRERGRRKKGSKLEGRSLATKAGKVERLDELASCVDPFMLRRLKHQVLADLPAKSRRVVPCRLSVRDMAHYQAAEADVVRWLRSVGAGLRASRAAHAKAIVRLTTLRYIAALGKVRNVLPEYLGRWFDRAVPEPLVVFTYHRAVTKGAWEICRKLGLRASGIGGRESTEKRQAAVDAFMGGWADVFIAPIMAAGQGLNLQRASEALFVERCWSYAQMVQAEDRIHRLGQLRPVTITYLDAVDTVDEQIHKLLHSKSRLVRATVDGIIESDSKYELAEILAQRMIDGEHNKGA